MPHCRSCQSLQPSDMRTILPATTGEMPIDRGLVASGARHPGPPSAVTLKRLQRYFGAVKQYKWMILAIVGAAIGAGLLATRFVPPSYEVNATLWISAETARRQDRGPIRGQELVAASGWVELLRSVALSEAVVPQLDLYLQPALPSDSLPFEQFGIQEHIMPGRYALRIDEQGQKYDLVRSKQVVEHGSVGDSVG